LIILPTNLKTVGGGSALVLKKPTSYIFEEN